MLSINALNYYKSIRNKLLELDEIINFIKKNNPIVEKQDIIINILKSTASRSDGKFFYAVQSPSTSEELCKNYKEKFSSFKKEFNVLTFFGKLTTVKSDISSLFNQYNHEDKNIISMLDNLNQLANLYQNVIQNNDDKKDIVIFFDATEKYIAEYLSVINSVNEFINVMTNDVNENEIPNTKELEIQLLDVDYNVGEFAKILQHLDVAYSTFARLVPNVSITQLQIVKIESGSLLSKILGNDNIIEVMGYTLKKVVDWVYHSYTKEGKIDLNSKLMQEISNDIELLEKFKTMGVDIDVAQHNLIDTFNVATKELHSIASMSPKIKIDDQVIMVNDTQKYLEYTTKYLGETTSDIINDEDDMKEELPQE